MPWLAIDEVLNIAGWSRYDVDAIATIRGIFPLHYYRFPVVRDFYYTVRKAIGRERYNRDLSHICTAYRTTDGDRFFRMWKYYLLACAGAFRARKLQLWQMVLSKGDISSYQPVR